jgi:hypothetical protein
MMFSLQVVVEGVVVVVLGPLVVGIGVELKVS